MDDHTHSNSSASCDTPFGVATRNDGSIYGVAASNSSDHGKSRNIAGAIIAFAIGLAVTVWIFVSTFL